MCGYCTEGLVFEIIASENAGKKAALDLNGGASHYLQDTTDLAEALERIMKRACRKKVVPITMVDDEVLLCRAIELLLTRGFEAPSYQELLKKRLFQRVVTEACTTSRRPQGELQCPAAVDLIDILYDKATFTTPDGAKKLRSLHLRKNQCQELLRWYIGWWLQGGSVRQEESVVEECEFAHFRSMFRAIFFSLEFLGRYRAAKPLLLKLVCGRPACIPYFDGLDLWLQRRAAVRMYDHFQMAQILPNLHEIRASLLFYIHLKREITLADREAIIDLVKMRPEVDKTDDYFSLSEWLAEAPIEQ